MVRSWWRSATEKGLQHTYRILARAALSNRSVQTTDAHLNKMMTSLGLKSSEINECTENFSYEKYEFCIIKEKQVMDNVKSEKLGENVLKN